MTTLYLRTREGKILAEIELYTRGREVTDLYCIVDVRNYSELLLSQLPKVDLISEFELLQDLREWFWEEWKNITDPSTPKDCSLTATKQAIAESYKHLTDKYKLCWTDEQNNF